MLAEDILGNEMTQLGENITNWAKDYIGTDFEFRENQFDVIYDICSRVINNETPTQIIEAPTGSGKSLILIISAGVLFKYYGLKSYILCSDLSLFKQYDDYIANHDALNHEFGRIKGQSGSNYECSQNHRPVVSGQCRLAKVAWHKLFFGHKSFKCASYCPYVKARKKALMAGVTLMTYQLYLRSVVLSKTAESGDSTDLMMFKSRPIIFCDECHNIPQIVQGAFCPTIRESIIENYQILWKYAMDMNNTLFKDEFSEQMEASARSIASTEQDLITNFRIIWDILIDENSTNEQLIEALQKLREFNKKFGPISEDIHSSLAKAIEQKDYIAPERVRAYEKCDWIGRFDGLIESYLMVIDSAGIDYLVRNVTKEEYEEDKVTGRRMKSKYPYSIAFTCAKEDFLINTWFIQTSKYQVLTSATVGGEHSFIENCGISNYEYTALPSTFDYTNSPIYYLGRWKMSNAFREQNFPLIRNAIYELCNRFDNKKGIIQTWTYANAKEIYDNAPEALQSRMLLYNGSSAKQEIIEYHKTTEVPTILIGPTLNEGIDLPGDECRFIILMKMPYPYLGDNLTKAKMKLFPSWYENETAKTVIQAIGRGNRYHDDWCVTYILDGCFGQLFNKTRDQFPMQIKERLKFFS